MSQILIVDTDSSVRNLLENQVNKLGYSCEALDSLYQGIAKAEYGGYDIVILDISSPDGNVLEKINDFKAFRSSPEVVVISGAGRPEEAELAIKAGAWDYIQKPVSSKVIHDIISRILQHRKLKSRTVKSSEVVREGIIGKSYQLQQCLDSLCQIASGSQSIFIHGETGTGKELFAKAVHLNSSRARKQFIVADCTSIPENLAESLLFGHVKGSFTGANSSTLGLFRQAEGGTLFLDEIGDLSLTIQKSFLRVLQEKKIKPVGANKEILCDFRLVSATNRNLEKMVAQGLFRKDLYYRLITSTLYLPPLRERKEDIQPLLDHYLQRSSEEYTTGIKTYSQDFLQAMLEYSWPGNIRELINAVNTACSSAVEEEELNIYHLPVDIRAHLAKGKVKPMQSLTDSSVEAYKDEDIIKITPTPEGDFPTYKQARQVIVGKMEKVYLKDLLVHSNRDILEACRLSGLSRARLYELLRKHDVVIKQ